VDIAEGWRKGRLEMEIRTAEQRTWWIRGGYRRGREKGAIGDGDKDRRAEDMVDSRWISQRDGERGDWRWR